MASHWLTSHLSYSEPHAGGNFTFPPGPMSASILRQLLARLLSRFLKFLGSIRGFPPVRLINHLFAFLASLRRWVRLNPRRPTLHQRQGPATSSATPNSGIVCAMNVPSPGPSDAHECARHSPVDSPYTNSRSPSGHLIPPSPAGRSSRDYISRIAGSQALLHEEPSEIHHGTSHVATDSILLTGSTPTICSHDRFHTSSSDSDTLTQSSLPPDPHHHTINIAPDTPPGTPVVKSSPRAAHLLFNNSNPEYHQSRTSLSAKSCISQNSIGRASYREYHGPPARERTPAASQHALVDPPSSPTQTTAEPGCVTAPPNADHSNRAGEPTNVAPRFAPMTADGRLRYGHRMIR